MAARLVLNILITYHHFVRDYRGSLLLKYALEALGHRVWLRAHWNDEEKFALYADAHAVVACQIAEHSTAGIAKFADDHGLHLVINASEQFTSPDRFGAFITYDCDKLSDAVISLQCVASAELKSFIDRYEGIRDSDKYKLLGFPRLDISCDPILRTVETAQLANDYALHSFGRKILYVSSLLFEETFADVGAADMEKWRYRDTIDRNHAVRRFHEPILDALLEQSLGTNGVLLIKKHPWDMSDYFEKRFRHPNVRVLSHHEYIVPCLAAVDAVLHSFSTSAIEAWILGKPTIALLPQETRPDLVLNHMQNEVFASSFDELISHLEAYPVPERAITVQGVLGGQADGKATLRLAREIDRLRPKPNRRLMRPPWRRRVRQEAEWWLQDHNIIEHAYHPNDSPKLQRMKQWETRRRWVERLYRPAFLDYLRRHREDLF